MGEERVAGSDGWTGSLSVNVVAVAMDERRECGSDGGGVSCGKYVFEAMVLSDCSVELRSLGKSSWIEKCGSSSYVRKSEVLAIYGCKPLRKMLSCERSKGKGSCKSLWTVKLKLQQLRTRRTI